MPEPHPVVRIASLEFVCDLTTQYTELLLRSQVVAAIAFFFLNADCVCKMTRIERINTDKAKKSVRIRVIRVIRVQQLLFSYCPILGAIFSRPSLGGIDVGADGFAQRGHASLLGQ